MLSVLWAIFEFLLYWIKATVALSFVAYLILLIINRLFFSASNAKAHPVVSNDRAGQTFTLIHGTWSRDASWISPDSPLCMALKETADVPVQIDELQWSGRNSFIDRGRASEELRKRFLKKGVKSIKKDKNYIIAHSHGGNIVFDSLTPDVMEYVDGVILLSTPFLHARKRHLDSYTKLSIFVSLFIVLASGMYITFGIVLNLVELSTVNAKIASVLLSAIIAALILLYFFKVRLPTIYKLSQKTNSDSIDPSKVLLLRATGDEASAALGAVHLLSWIAFWLLSRPSKVAEFVLVKYERFKKWLIFFVFIGAIFFLAISVLLLYDEETLVLIEGILVMAVISFITAFVTVAFFGAVDLVIRLTIVIILTIFATLLLPSILFLGTLAYGNEFMITTLFVEVTAEPTPAGNWQVVQLPADPPGSEKESDGIAGPEDSPRKENLQHSLAFLRADAIVLICNWIKEKNM